MNMIRRGAKTMDGRNKKRLGAVAAIGLAAGAWGLGSAAAAPGDKGAPAATGTEAAIESCMHDRGHVVDLAADDPIVLSDGEVAAQYGYGISTPIVVEGKAPPDTDETLGADLGACADAVRPESAGDRLQAAYGRLARSLTADEAKSVRDLDEHVASLPGADAALAEWQACMTAAGYDQESPGAARASIAARAESARGPELAAEERALAVADVGCRESVLFPRLADVIDRAVASR